MPMAAVPVIPTDRFPMPIPMQTASSYPETFARDAIIAWFRGEFAAANAIIDALCNHLTQLDGITGGTGGGSDYESVFAAIHRRRLNWIPVIQMQKFFSIADVSLELRKVAAKKMKRAQEEEMRSEDITKAFLKEEESIEVAEEVVEAEADENQNCVEEIKEELKQCVDDNGLVQNGDRESLKEESDGTDSSSDHKNINGGLDKVQHPSEDTRICLNHEDCESRRTQIKMTKGFIAKEPVKGHMVNVVKGLKLYEDIFTESELSKLTDYINELHLAGRNGELSGETFALFNQQLKGNKRELIQLGVPIFGQVKDDGKYNIEPIPSVIQTIIDHLVQWHLIPESRRPNSCIINFFDEGESSQPYLKPPHLDQPISSLYLAESEMAFGRVLVSDNHGNYKGPLMLTIKEGSLLVMRGNSADMARHVMCPSPNKRVSLTFCKVRSVVNQVQPSTNIAPITKAMTLWQPGLPQSYKMPNGGAMNGAFKGYDCMEVIPKWGVLHHPLVMLAPMQPMPMSPRRLPRGGTGVFLPWNVGSKKHMKHLPPRAQRGRLLALPSPAEPQVIEPASDLSVRVCGHFLPPRMT